MTEWNKDMAKAPNDEPCWIYIPMFEMVHDTVTIAECDGEVWTFGEFEVANDEKGDDGEFLGPEGWMPIKRPPEPDWAEQ